MESQFSKFFSFYSSLEGWAKLNCYECCVLELQSENDVSTHFLRR